MEQLIEDCGDRAFKLGLQRHYLGHRGDINSAAGLFDTGTDSGTLRRQDGGQAGIKTETRHVTRFNIRRDHRAGIIEDGGHRGAPITRQGLRSAAELIERIRGRSIRLMRWIVRKTQKIISGDIQGVAHFEQGIVIRLFPVSLIAGYGGAGRVDLLSKLDLGETGRVAGDLQAVTKDF